MGHITDPRWRECNPVTISVGALCSGILWGVPVRDGANPPLLPLLSILFRQTVRTTFSGIAISILPHLIGGSFLKYVLPLPAGLLAGTGYVWGDTDRDWI